MPREIKIEKEKVIKVQPKMMKTFLGEPISSNEKPEYLKDMPNQKLHKIVSFIKSGVRIVSCVLGLCGLYEVGFGGLIFAELIGVFEEMV